MPTPPPKVDQTCADCRQAITGPVLFAKRGGVEVPVDTACFIKNKRVA